MPTESPAATSLSAFPGTLDDGAWRQLFLDARSNLNFDGRPVPLELLREVFDYAKLGPTGNNAGPLRLLVAASDDARGAVIAAATPANRPKLELAPALLVVARDDRYHDHLHITAPGAEHVKERLEGAVEERLQKAHDGTWLQAGYLILALRAAGLAVRPYGGFDKAAINDGLLSDTSWSAEMLLGVGYATEGDHGAGERRGRLPWDDAARVV